MGSGNRFECKVCYFFSFLFAYYKRRRLKGRQLSRHSKPRDLFCHSSTHVSVFIPTSWMLDIQTLALFKAVITQLASPPKSQVSRIKINKHRQKVLTVVSDTFHSPQKHTTSHSKLSHPLHSPTQTKKPKTFERSSYVSN